MASKQGKRPAEIAKRAALYVRLSVSTDESTSIARQLEQAQRYAELHGWTIVETYKDDGVSGGLKDRPGLTAMLTDAKAKAFDVVIVAKLDRLARSISIFDTVRSELADHDIDLVSVAEGFDLTTPAGRAMAGILATFAAFERERISERVAESHAALAKAGRWNGGPVPYGWTPEELPTGGYRLALEPDESAVMREAVSLVLKGKPLASIARQLGLGDDRLRELLRNPLMLGQHVFKGQVVVGSDAMPLTPHDALLMHDEWTELQYRLTEKAQPHLRNSETPALLSALGILHCGTCGGAMRANRQVRPHGLRETYVCQKGCASISMQLLDEYIEAHLLRNVGDLTFYEVDVTPPTDNSREIETARERQRSIAGLLAEGLLDESTARDQLKLLKKRIEVLEAQSQPASTTHRATEYTWRQAWEAGDLSTRREMTVEYAQLIMVNRGQRGVTSIDEKRVRVHHPLTLLLRTDDPRLSAREPSDCTEVELAILDAFYESL